MRITFSEWLGVMRRVEPTMLPRTHGQAAENLWPERSDLRPIEQNRTVKALGQLGVKSIYRFGQALDSETDFWFAWTQVVDVAKAQVAGDTSERTMWTGQGVPKFTNAALGTTGTVLPSGSRPLALPPPTTPPTLTLVANTGTTTAIQRDYVYTFVNDLGDESAPSPVATINCGQNQHIALSDIETVPTNNVPVAARRIYRSEDGTYLFVAEIGAAGGTYTDNVPADSLGYELQSVDWDPPPDNLAGLTNLPNGIMAGFVGNDLYFCEPYRPYAWPERYRMAMPFPIVGLGVIDQTCVVLTTGAAQMVSGIDPGGMDQRPAKLAQPCVSKQSIANTGGSVLYASESGLCQLTTGDGQILTLDLFTPAQWRDTYRPETIVGTWHDGLYIATYQPLTGGRKGFAFSPRSGAFVDLPALTATAFYRDTVTSSLYCCVNDSVQVFRGGTGVHDMRWLSPRVFTQLTQLTWLCVAATKYPARVKVYADGQLKDDLTVASLEPVRVDDLPRSGLCRAWEIEVSGDTQVQRITLATSPTEAAVG